MSGAAAGVLSWSRTPPVPVWRPRLPVLSAAILRRDGARAGGGRPAAPVATAAASDLLSELIADSGERVFRVALSVLGPGSEADAEDVAQEVFLRAHRALGSFRGDSSPSTWLYRTAYNLAVDHLRRRGRTGHREDDEVLERMPTGEPASDPHRQAVRSERERTVEALLETLPEAQRAALRLHYWMGHTVAEIAELLDAAPGTVKSHLHRGRERLRQRLTAGPVGEEGAP